MFHWIKFKYASMEEKKKRKMWGLKFDGDIFIGFRRPIPLKNVKCKMRENNKTKMENSFPFTFNSLHFSIFTRKDWIWWNFWLTIFDWCVFKCHKYDLIVIWVDVCPSGYGVYIYKVRLLISRTDISPGTGNRQNDGLIFIGFRKWRVNFYRFLKSDITKEC